MNATRALRGTIDAIQRGADYVDLGNPSNPDNPRWIGCREEFWDALGLLSCPNAPASIYFITKDGGALTAGAALANKALIEDAIFRADPTGGWLVVGWDVNFDDAALVCVHTGRRIEYVGE